MWTGEEVEFTAKKQLTGGGGRGWGGGAGREDDGRGKDKRGEFMKTMQMYYAQFL